MIQRMTKRQILTLYEYEEVSEELNAISRLFSTLADTLRGNSDEKECFTMRITYHGCEEELIADFEIEYPAQANEVAVPF